MAIFIGQFIYFKICNVAMKKTVLGPDEHCDTDMYY